MTDDLSADGKFPLRYLILACCLVIGTLTTRLWRLDTPADLYWDEIYFGFTAQQYLDGNPDAYNPFATPPQNRAYEWTHPPLGKLIIAATMAVTTDDMWGMRLAGVLFGTASVALVVLVAFLLTRSPPAALLAGLLYAMDGLNFVMSRIATIDVFQTTFILAALAFYIGWRRRDGAPNWLLLGAGLMAGATLSTKWVGLFLIALLGADLLVLWIIRRRRADVRTILTAGVCLLLVPAAVYMASYIHYFLMGYGLADFVELQKQMWYYHTGLKEIPTYASKPLQWVFNLRPVWLYVEYDNPPGAIANIYNLGNSVVLYFGLIAMLLTAVRFVRRSTGISPMRSQPDREPEARGTHSQDALAAGTRWQWEAGFLLAAYLIFWVPWVRSPRAMYFYHYMPSTAMLCVASGWMLANWLTARHWALRALTTAIPLLAMVWFILFYPNMTAIAIPKWWADAVYCLIPTWK